MPPGYGSVIISTDPALDLDPYINKQNKKNLDLCCLPTDSLMTCSLKSDVNVHTESNMQKKFEKKIILCWHLESHLTKRAGSGSGSEFFCQVYGSKDPDPYQNVTDPEHW